MYDLTKSQKEIQKAARDFAKGEFDKTLARDLDRDETFPQTIWRRAAELGFTGIQFPEVFGGGGLGLMEAVLLAETLCQADSSLGAAVLDAAAGGAAIARFGTEAQKKSFLEPVLGGRKRSAAAFQEAATSLASLPEATAAAQADGWRLQGVKSYVGGGLGADFFVVLCRDAQGDQDAGTASMFIVEAGLAGVSLAPEGRRLGGNLSPGAALGLEGVDLGPDGLLGRQGRGMVQLEAYFTERRILQAAQTLGMAQGALDRAVAYARQRIQFNRKIAVFQATRHKIAEMALAVDAARALVYAAARAFDRGKADGRMAAAAKLSAAAAAVRAADEAIQIHGGYGYMREYDVERFYRDAKAVSLNEGTPGQLRDLIGTAVVGKVK